MPQLRVFVSSTAYDLGPVRGQIRSFISSLGHQPVLSEYSQVLFDPTAHTHDSCVQELKTCDVVVLIIGARWGSQAVPEFVDELTKLSLHDVDGKMSEMIVNHQISVTQLEALTAFGLGIPIFALVDENVRSEARMYEANRELADAGHLKFPTVGDSGAARFIFSFLSYIESRPTGNAIVQFRQIEDIQNHLRVQWSAMLQRLLSAAAVARREQGLVEELGERIEDLKAVLLGLFPIEGVGPDFAVVGASVRG